MMMATIIWQRVHLKVALLSRWAIGQFRVRCIMGECAKSTMREYNVLIIIGSDFRFVLFNPWFHCRGNDVFSLCGDAVNYIRKVGF